MDHQVKYLLQESELPRQWYNVIPDLPSPPPPPLHPGTHEPVGPDALAPLFPMALIQQEVSPERYIEIPESVLDVYRLWRPTPLFRARRLEKDLGTPARIYYKYEGGSPAGSHKPNTAVPQAYYNKAEGVSKLTTETGAGQWGSALAFACALYGLDLEVWMVRASYDQKPYRRLLMEAYGATVHPSPSDITSAGKAVLAEHPDSTGSLGIAISEAVEVAGPDPAIRYALGSVLNHVLLHQTVIGEEALNQLAQAGDTPDLIIGCTGGGSNFSGLVFPFLREKLAGKMNPVLRAVERRLRLRFRGHGRHDAVVQDAHPRARLRAGSDPRGRAALPRHVAAAVAHVRAGPVRGGGQAAVGVLRGGAAVRPDRGHPARAGAHPRARSHHRGGAAVQGDR
jgi:tryptophan synthase beta chain